MFYRIIGFDFVSAKSLRRARPFVGIAIFPPTGLKAASRHRLFWAWSCCPACADTQGRWTLVACLFPTSSLRFARFR